MSYLLHVDDDEDDIILFEEVLQKFDPVIGYKSFLFSAKALDFLKSTTDYPCVILMDLNMPGLGGKELMKRIKEDPQLCEIPILCLSTSNQPSDKSYCLQYCDNYFIKPIDYRQYLDLVQLVASLCKSRSSKSST